MQKIRYILRILYSYYSLAECCGRKKEQGYLRDGKTRMWPETCREKPLKLHVIRLIGCILDPVPRRLPMSYGREESQMLSILEFLEVLVSFSRIGRMWENLTPEAMKE